MHLLQGFEEFQGIGSIANPLCSGLRQLRLASPPTRVIDPAKDHVELNGDLWMRVFAHLPAQDLLFGCCAVSRQWRDWVHELSASQLSYRQDFTCRSCGHQVSYGSHLTREKTILNVKVAKCRL